MAVPRVTLLLALLTAVGQALAASSSPHHLEALGKTIFAKDRAAWLATDRLAESTGGIPDELRGWVTLPADDGWRVFFVQEQSDAYCHQLVRRSVTQVSQ